jgi:hypothetical protein
VQVKIAAKMSQKKGKYFLKIVYTNVMRVIKLKKRMASLGKFTKNLFFNCSVNQILINIKKNEVNSN